MNTQAHNKKVLALIFLTIACCALVSSLYMRNVQSNYVTFVQEAIKEQQETLRTLSKMASTDSADDKTKRIITDCSLEHRDRFDTLLGSLATLRGAELLEVENLFNECGSFYPVREGVVVKSLERELEVYTDYITLLSLAHTQVDTKLYALDEWKNIVSLHGKKSELSLHLVSIQGEIIKALKARTPIQSESMQTLLKEGQDTKESLLVVSQQIVDAEAKLRGI